MKSSISYSLLLAAAASSVAFGQTTAYTTPVGYVSTSCISNSDTIVGLPLRKPAVAASALSAVPDTASVAGSAVLALSGSPGFTSAAFANTHYVKFSSGTSAGQWFVVTANTADTLTVNLNGATLSAAAADTVEVIKFWTLAELINPATATTDPATTVGPIVASSSTLTAGRKTELLIPNLNGTGTNLAPTATYYIHNSIWKKSGQSNTNFGADQLWPDSYIIIRNPVVASATTFTVSGEVDTKEFDYSLSTLNAAKQDNFIGLARPVDTPLSSLGLGGTSAFTTSTSTLTAGRRDELLVFNNSVTAKNKAPAATYYYNAGAWKLNGTNANSDSAVIPAGAGFIIRKYQVAGGPTVNWNNTASY